jgi:hypothetical protein
MRESKIIRYDIRISNHLPGQVIHSETHQKERSKRVCVTNEWQSMVAYSGGRREMKV